MHTLSTRRSRGAAAGIRSFFACCMAALAFASPVHSAERVAQCRPLACFNKDTDTLNYHNRCEKERPEAIKYCRSFPGKACDGLRESVAKSCGCSAICGRAVCTKFRVGGHSDNCQSARWRE